MTKLEKHQRETLESIARSLGRFGFIVIPEGEIDECRGWITMARERGIRQISVPLRRIKKGQIDHFTPSVSIREFVKNSMQYYREFSEDQSEFRRKFISDAKFLISELESAIKRIQ